MLATRDYVTQNSINEQHFLFEGSHKKVIKTFFPVQSFVFSLFLVKFVANYLEHPRCGNIQCGHIPIYEAISNKIFISK